MQAELLTIQEPAVSPEKPRHDAILFGQDPTERIVAVEPADGRIVLWRRLGSGVVERLEEPFVPRVLAAEADPELGGTPPILEGGGYPQLYEVSPWGGLSNAPGHGPR